MFLRNIFFCLFVDIEIKVTLYSGVCIVCGLTFDWRYLQEQILFVSSFVVQLLSDTSGQVDYMCI